MSSTKLLHVFHIRLSYIAVTSLEIIGQVTVRFQLFRDLFIS